MARTKQTARKDTGGKPLAMGRGKANPKKNPTPGRADRKVLLEYSSDEENPQQAEGAAAPKRVKKQIHLTLPTSPAHVTTTESFMAFFINHGLTRALQKAFAGRGWSTDQMREFVANFQKKHGQQVPMPKIYGDEDTSDDEGPELADGTKAAKKKTTGSARGGDGPSTSGRGAGGSKVESEPGLTMMMKMTLTNAGRQRVKMHHQSRLVARKEPRKKGQGYPPIDRKAASPLHLSPKGENHAGPPRTGLDRGAEEEDTRGEDAGETSKTPPVQSRDCGSTRHPPLPENYGASDTQATFPEVGEGDRPGLQDRSAVPVSGDIVSPRSGGGIPCQVV